jgi:hypothetical protein
MRLHRGVFEALEPVVRTFKTLWMQFLPPSWLVPRLPWAPIAGRVDAQEIFEGSTLR